MKAGELRGNLMAGRLFPNFKNCRRRAKHCSLHIRPKPVGRKIILGLPRP
jgi:hypothetical protein